MNAHAITRGAGALLSTYLNVAIMPAKNKVMLMFKRPARDLRLRAYELNDHQRHNQHP